MPDASGNILPGEPGYVPKTGLLQAPAVKQATASTPTAIPFTVAPEATVASNVKDIFDADGPLMQQAASRARGQANARGLLNSSIAISAGQSALYDAALPIAQADAATYARAAENTVAAKNAAEMQRANIETSTSQFNTAAQNTQQLATGENQVRVLLQNLQSNTQLTGIERQIEAQKVITAADNTARAAIAQLQSDTSLKGLDKQIAGQKIITDADNAARAVIAHLQSDTTLTLGQKQIAAQQSIAAADNAARAVIAQLQADTTLTAAEKQIAANEILSLRESETKVVMQRFQLDADLQKINADGSIRRSLADTEAQYKVLMQTSAGAADLYKQTIANLASIVTNPDVADKAGALNLGVRQLDDALKMIGDVANLDLGSYLTFDVPAGAAAPAVAAPAPAPATSGSGLLSAPSSFFNVEAAI